MSELYTIEGVEIFATGTHNGDPYTDQDLDHLIEHYSKVGFTPPLKDGHYKDKPGMPALGWVRNLRRFGKKLIADFCEMPKVVYEAIKNRRYDRVSAEIFWDYCTGHETYDRVLKAVSLLGAEIPAVAELKPLREVVFGNGTSWAAEKAYEIALEEQRAPPSPYCCPPTAYIGKLTDGSLALHAIEFYEWTRTQVEGWLAAQGLAAKDLVTLGSESYRRFLAVIRSSDDFDPGSIKTGFAYQRKQGDGETWVVVYAELPKDARAAQVRDAERQARERAKPYTTTAGTGGPVAVITHFYPPSGRAAMGTPWEGTGMDPKLKELSDQLTAVKVELEAKTKELEDLRNKSGETPQIRALAEQVTGLTKELSKVTEENAARRKEVDELTEKGRQARIKEKAHACRVPAFRGFITALYDITTGLPADKLVKVYDEKGNGKDALPEAVVDELVSTINKATEHLFIQHSKVGELRRDDAPSGDNPRETVDLRVKRYQAEHPKTEYPEAMKAVLDADPALKDAYAKS